MIVGCVTMTQTKTIAQEDTQENGSHSVTKISDQSGDQTDVTKSNSNANAKIGTFLYEKYKFQNLTQSDEIKIENFSIFVKYLLTHLNSQDTTNAKLLKFLKTAHFSDNLTGSIPKMLYKILFYNQNGEISDRGLKMSFYELSFEVCKYFKMTVATNTGQNTGGLGVASASSSSNSTMMINTINSLNSNNKNIENISFEDFKRILLIVPEKSFYIFGHEFIKNINKIYSTPIILYNIMQASLFFEDFKKIQTVLFNILKPYLLSWVNKLDLLNNRNGKGARKIYETYRAVLDVVPL